MKYCPECGTQQNKISKDKIAVRIDTEEEIYHGDNYTFKIKTNQCIGCGECVDICPVDVYTLKEGKAYVDSADECLGCESCIEVCEFDAIEILEKDW